MNSILNALPRVNLRLSFAVFFLLLLSVAVSVSAQNLDRLQRSRAKDMLKAVKNEIKEKYYDSNYKGVNLDERFKIAEDKLDQASSLGQAFGIIAQAVLDLNDSHTTFYPPSRSTKFDYGVRMQMIGNKCFVINVRPGSDAEKKGLQPGDQILSIEGFKPNRKDMWKMMYYYKTLSPRPGMNLVVQSPSAKEPREVSFASKVKTEKTILDFEDLLREVELSSDDVVEHRFVQVGNTVIWKMPTFATEPSIITGIMQGKLSRAGNLILDLRGNGGGYVVTLEELAGYFVEKDTKIADLKGRKEMKPQMAKSKGKDVYKGNLIVLIDSNSGSASELFARFVQIHQRGVVIGDQSAGAVMQSRGVPMQLGADSIIPYGLSITNADVIMTDGNSLEHIGVTPQLVMLPTGADLAAGRDVVLAAALQLFGEKVAPEQAGKFFPYKWKDN